MQIIDAHQHFWKYDREIHHWITDEMSVLKRDFLARDMEAAFAQNGVTGSIAVQADQSEAETNFLLDLANKNDFIKGIVGWVDLQSPQIEERLEYYSQFPKLKGFRHIVQGEPDNNFMLGKAFQNGIAALGKYNFTYDILIFPTQMEAALQTVKNFPNQVFVIDHLAKPYIKDQKINSWAKYMYAFGVQGNVFCKVSGMVTEADWSHWKYKDFEPYLKVVFEAFGNDRILFGSDFPVCLLAGSYKSIKGIVEQFIQDFLEADQRKIMGENALKFYKINQQ